MNWIFYITIFLAKILAISGLVFLFMVAVPVIVTIFILGMFLGYLRDVETHSIYKLKFTAPTSFRYIQFIYIPTALSRIQHVLMHRYRSNS